MFILKKKIDGGIMTENKEEDPGTRSIHSFIEPHEEQEAKILITKELGFEFPNPCGFQICVKPHLSEDDEKCFFYDKSGRKITSSIIKPDLAKQFERHQACVGLVIGKGTDCYQGSVTSIQVTTVK